MPVQASHTPDAATAGSAAGGRSRAVMSAVAAGVVVSAVALAVAFSADGSSPGSGARNLGAGGAPDMPAGKRHPRFVPGSVEAAITPPSKRWEVVGTYHHDPGAFT